MVRYLPSVGFARDGDAGGFAWVDVEREVAGGGSVCVLVVKLYGKDSFGPDLGGAAGFEPLADPGRPCWREWVTELVQDRYGVLVVRAFAFGHEVITCGLGGKPVE